ncbi:MAG TPA: hypothetical protein VF483_08465 [Gemmatimonadaceae bacterium]
MYRGRRLSAWIGAACLAVVTSSAAAQAPAKVDLAGKWLLTVTTDNGTGTPTVTLQQKGDSLTGHYSSQVFGEQEVHGSAKDGKFRFAFSGNVQGQSFTVTYSGTIESVDSIKGTLDLGGFGSGTFTGARQKTPPGGG